MNRSDCVVLELNRSKVIYDCGFARRTGVFFGAMQECFYARLRACIAGMAVRFDDGEWFAFHHIRCEVQVETVRTAGIVAAVQCVRSRRAANLVRDAQNVLAIAPIHIGKHWRVCIQRKAVNRNSYHALLAQYGRNV